MEVQIDQSGRNLDINRYCTHKPKCCEHAVACVKDAHASPWLSCVVCLCSNVSAYILPTILRAVVRSTGGFNGAVDRGAVQLESVNVTKNKDLKEIYEAKFCSL